MSEARPGRSTTIRPQGLRMYKKDDPDMPEEFRQFMIKLLKYSHVENNGNPHYRELVADIANAGLRYAPSGREMMIEAEIVIKVVPRIVAKITAKVSILVIRL